LRTSSAEFDYDFAMRLLMLYITFLPDLARRPCQVGG
jgi:hypothetical protein